MESLAPALDALRAWPGAAWLRQSGTAYLFVSAAHILGLGLTLGAILPLDLRFLGLGRAAPLHVLAPFLIRASAAGLTLALVTGFWLFSVKPAAYLANEAFLWKLALLVAAGLNIALQHAHANLRAMATGRPTWRTRLHALASALLWLGVLLAGRWIGFL